MNFPQLGHVCVESVKDSEHRTQHRKHGAQSQQPKQQQTTHVIQAVPEGSFDTAVVIWKKRKMDCIQVKFPVYFDCLIFYCICFVLGLGLWMVQGKIR